MRYQALATDYDGTLAHDGAVDRATLAALERLKASGRKLLLVSGRELPHLRADFDRLDLFDLAVLENGATLHAPATGATRVLAAPPPPAFAAALQARGAHPFSAGEVVVATDVRHVEMVRAALAEFGLASHIILNKNSLMVLPRGVNKASGLATALADMGLSAGAVVGVGDAENDADFLAACGFPVAVANALPDLKAAAHLVTAGARGAGVAELIDLILTDRLGA
ncbi:MAG: HAD family phosphatase [Planctomycetes bacterium]|nr:HAD family phosphatase [Planctomycetota bacterium]